MLQVFGSPLAAALLSLDGLLGVQGWQWLFILEGVPTIVLGIYIMWTLPASPAEAAFLTEEERHWVLSKHGRGTLVRACASAIPKGSPICSSLNMPCEKCAGQGKGSYGAGQQGRGLGSCDGLEDIPCGAHRLHGEHRENIAPLLEPPHDRLPGKSGDVGLFPLRPST